MDILKQNNMTTIDLYTNGYLGELETTLIEKDNQGNIVFKLRLFSAIFNEFLGFIPYDGTNHHESVMYLCNTEINNWGKDFSLAPRVQEFYDQLVLIESQATVDGFMIEEYNALKQICISTLANNNQLYIKLYD
jgi:hypothetical protein